ncbi:Hint domain-containing protein [Commensalibacter nepenthis]|uniref:Hint domain-containing protein n=1 Tax=Commensalibacter nepenthis TaxID=3043872 RepID=A0ABT6Q9X0_9PROT|nr:Hint domain-containing protein [Commensalibacter sp. TBRC 10068]MDI2113557.1 Hint domain-containing protein [Commensalibacter sp. TBRC 10068]
MDEQHSTQSIIQYAEDGQIIINNGSTYDVMYNKTVSNVQINSGGTLNVNAGSAVHILINGGTQSVTGAGGYTSDVTINNGGSQYIAGTIAENVVINSGGKQDVNVYGNATNVIINNGGKQTVSGVGKKTASVDSVTINSGGEQYIGLAGSASDTIIDGGIQYVYDGGYAYNTTINSGGIQYVSAGAMVTNTTINSGGRLEPGSASWGGNNEKVTFTNITVNSGGTLVTGGAILEGVITLNEGATVDLGFQTSSDATLNLVGKGSHTIIVTYDGLNKVYDLPIEGFQGGNGVDSDRIVFEGLENYPIASMDYTDGNGKASDDYVTIHFASNGYMTLHIVGIKQMGFSISQASDGSFIGTAGDHSGEPPCFLAGSMIKIPGGEIAVEALSIGDKICTFDWKKNKKAIRSICWIGSNIVVVQPHLSDDKAGYPVRIHKDAIADGVPYKDLLITAEHCLFFDGKFIPVRMLVNGTSICYDYSITQYTYYHIETKRHSVIWADGMLTESYLDTVNHKGFRQHGQFAILDVNSKVKDWEHDSAAPLMVDRAYVEPLYHQIAQRAFDMGFVKEKGLSLTTDSDFHLVTDCGESIYPQFDGKDKYIFVLTENICKVYLKSRTSRPCDTIGPFVDDRRQLGLLVGNITLLSFDKENKIQPYEITSHLTEQNLAGWGVIEPTSCRWTHGNAELDISLRNNQKRALIIQVISSNAYVISDQNDMLDIKKIA